MGALILIADLALLLLGCWLYCKWAESAKIFF
jgi:hypothetical protein